MNKQIYTSKLVGDPCVYEGFEPNTVLEEVTSKHFQDIIAIIRREDYSIDDKFSTVSTHPYFLILNPTLAFHIES